MGKIRILPDILVSKIAAGEVVERPASVVKELLENSVDAGSSKISIYLKGGGKRLIRIVDDGYGMSRDDALMSLERHATSKIRNVDDLFSLNTLGFRGEALPSIASVSRFTLTSRANDQDTATEIIIEGGVIKSVKDKGAPKGTAIEVKNLFFNTRPRLKFLRKPETEFLRITEVIQREAISRPDVSFEVFSEDKEIYRYTSQKSQIDRISQIIPNTELFKFVFKRQEITVEGYLSSPLENRTSMQKLYTYVNGRPLRDRFINRSIMDAYGNLIEKSRFPLGVVFISVDSKHVDVNVHPTKSEVKFQNQYYVGETIKEAIRNMLGEAPWIKGYKKRAENALKNYYQDQKSKSLYGDVNRNFDSSSEFYETKMYKSDKNNRNFDLEENKDPYGYSGAKDKYDSDENYSNTDLGSFYSGLKYIGQIGKLYLVCETESGIVIVDQHAAHERVNFEKIKKAYINQNQVQSQELLIPEILELSPLELGISDQFKSDINKLGFNFDLFGDSTIRISSVPGFLINTSYKEIFLNLLNEFDNLGEGKSVKESLDLVCATIACHGSIRANQKLSSEEVIYLFRDLDKCDYPHACPHGRPIVTEISYNTLEKMFRRT